MKIPAIPGFAQHSFEKYLKNTGWLMFGRVLSMIVGFKIANYLGPSNFGNLTVVDALTTIVAAVGTLGLDSFIIREILHEPANRDEVLGTAFWLRIGVNLLLFPLPVIIYLVYHYLSPNPGNSLTIIVVLLASVSLFKSFNVIDSYFQSQVYSKPVVQVQNVCLFLSSALKLAFVYFEMPLVYFAVALVFDAVILAGGLTIIYHKQSLHLSAWKFSKSRAKSLLSQSWPLIITGAMITLYMKIDILMLKALGSIQPGIYGAAAKISEAWYFIPIAIVTSVFPALIQARKTDLVRYEKRLQNLYDLLVGISLPIALIINYFADNIIHLAYGHAYEGAGAMLAIHIWSGVFVFLGSASSQYLLAEGFTMISFIRTGIGAVLNILLNVWLIPLHGGIGASIATLIACAVSTFAIIAIPATRRQGLIMLKSLFLISIVQNAFVFLSEKNKSAGQ